MIDGTAPDVKPPGPLTVRTEVIDDPRPLLTILPSADDRSIFVREGEGVVAAGTVHRFPVGTGAGRLADLERAIATLAASATIDDPVGLPGTGLLTLASLTFDPAEEGSVAVVPRTVVGRSGDVTWRTTISDPAASAPEAVDDAVAAGPPGVPDRPRYAGSSLADEGWLEAVAQALAAIEAGAYEKVVLARDLRLWSRTPFDVAGILEALADRFPSCFTFAVDGLVGASPERLIERRGSSVRSRVLAGTARRGEDATEDARLAAELLTSEKDLREHALAVRSAVGPLAPVCATLDVPDAPSLVVLDNVQHLGTELVGTLAGPTHVLELLDRLHPTAAVGGTPREAALAAIGTLEGMSRGRYAGPVGWCTPDGDGEFAIALRCAEISGGRARLLAGAGIVAGSLPEVELLETWGKLRAMTGVLGFTPATPDGRERA